MSADDGRVAAAQMEELYTLPPEKFTAARDELARTLRSGGDRGAAAAVKKLRRPTVVAWALNQLARRHRDEVDTLLEAGEALRQAQRKVLSGLGPAPMREAQQRRREVVDELVDRAAGLLRERGSVTDAQLTAVRRGLEAASVDGEAAAALLQARLSQAPETDTGFDSVEGLTLVARPGTGAAVAGPAGAKAGAEADRAARADRRAEETRQAEEARQAEARAEQARRAEAERAAARLAAAEREARRAAEEARARKHEAARAAAAASEAQAEVERLSRELEAAQEHAQRASARAGRAAALAQAAAEAAERRERERRAASRSGLATDHPGIG